MAPVTIGNKNLKFYLIFLKKFSTQLSKFSYIPKITHSTPLLIPGRIAPAPISMPLKKSLRYFKKSTPFCSYNIKYNKIGILIPFKYTYEKNNKICFFKITKI